jgi:hypothetical protein
MAEESGDRAGVGRECNNLRLRERVSSKRRAFSPPPRTPQRIAALGQFVDWLKYDQCEIVKLGDSHFSFLFLGLHFLLLFIETEHTSTRAEKNSTRGQESTPHGLQLDRKDYVPPPPQGIRGVFFENPGKFPLRGCLLPLFTTGRFLRIPSRYVNKIHLSPSIYHQDLDALLRLAAQRKINSYRQQYADNQNTSFLPAIVSTSTRMHGEFLRLLFLQAHRETEAHFTAAEMSSQRNQSDSFGFKRAAFYQSLKSKVGPAAAKVALLRINLNVQGCGIVAAPVHAPSRAPLLLPLLLLHNLPLSPAFTSA